LVSAPPRASTCSCGKWKWKWTSQNRSELDESGSATKWKRIEDMETDLYALYPRGALFTLQSCYDLLYIGHFNQVALRNQVFDRCAGIGGGGEFQTSE
jgi:hypothetical protein